MTQLSIRLQAAEHQIIGAPGDMVGHGRDDPGHMRGVLLHGEKPAGIDRPGDKGQGVTQVPVGQDRAFAPGQAPGIADRHGARPSSGFPRS